MLLKLGRDVASNEIYQMVPILILLWLSKIKLITIIFATKQGKIPGVI